MYHAVLDDIFEKFQEYAATARAIILAPESKHGDALVARLLGHKEYTALYYALSSEDAEMTVFIDNMTRAFIDRNDLFGRYTSQANLHWNAEKQNLRDIVIAGMVRDLNSMADQRVLIILDDFDQAEQADDVHRFIEELALQLPPHCLLIINGRAQPRFPWNSLISKTRAMIFNDGQIMTLTSPTQSEETFAEIEIYALGPGFIYCNGEYIGKWEGHLPRLLMFFAVDRGVITREDFHRAFWNDLNDMQATNVFHVTKRRLHRAFDMEILEHKGGDYRIRPGISIYYDANEWTESLLAARDMANADRASAYERVLSLYRGPFLKGHDDGWILDRRNDLLAGYIEAVLFLANHSGESYVADPEANHAALDHAIHLYHTALAEAPNHPEVVLAAAELLSHPVVSRRIEAHQLLQSYMDAKKAEKESADPRITALSKKLHSKKSA
ncbi:MAG: bacterial transcriptional activator domain-containing protein [Anaerolineae bacterium]|jgi:hypothetical protein|nr:bacterial transcriptional activator domain-containing protein [Anaerolineae bacterium]